MRSLDTQHLSLSFQQRFLTASLVEYSLCLYELGRFGSFVLQYSTMALLLTPTSLKQKLTPPAQTGPFYAETPETSKAFYKLATTPSPKVKKQKRTSRSQTPSPNDSRSLHDSEEEIECQLSKGETRDVPSGLGLGLGLPGLPRDNARDPLNWRFSTITKPSSTSEPSSPSPSDSVAGDRRQKNDADNYSIYTLTPGPAWPPPPSSTVSPEDTPRIPATIEAEDPQPPMSPLTPAISQLLDEISEIPRPPDVNDDAASKMVTTVQAWVLDMPLAGRGRGRGRGNVEVRRMRSWKDLRAEGLRRNNFTQTPAIPPVPAVHIMPSPPITPPSDSPLQDRQNEHLSHLVGNLTSPSLNYDDDRIIISPPNDYEPHVPLLDEETDIETSSDSGSESDTDAESVEEILPRKTLEPESPLIPRPSPDPDSDLVHDIEVLLESSPIRKREQREVEQRAAVVASERNMEEKENMVDSGTLQPPSMRRLKTDDRADSIRTSSPDNEAFFTPREQGTPFFEKRNPFSKSSTSLNSPPFQLSDIPPLPANAALLNHDPPETPTRPPIPRKSTSRLNLPKVKVESEPSVDLPTTTISQPLINSVTASQPTKAVQTTPPIKFTEVQQLPLSRPVIPQRRSSLSHSRNGSSDSVPLSNYPPVSLQNAFGTSTHIRGKSIDSSSLYNRERNDRRYHSQRRQRSSSANAVGTAADDHRGRGRSRSIDDGPPTIPSRTSSLGKTGKPATLLDQLAQKLSRETDRPVLVRAASSRETDEEHTLRPSESNISIRESIEIFGSEEKAEIAEVVSRSSSMRGHAKQVIVRSPSHKQSEFERPVSKQEESGKHLTPKIPQFSFGDGPNLTLEEATSKAQVNESAQKSKDHDHNSVLELPVVFQVIPPTPFAFNSSEEASKQLGVQVPQLIQIPATPDPTSAAGDYLLVKPFHPATPVPNSTLSGENMFALAFDHKSDFHDTLQNSLLIPPTEDKKSTPPPDAERPRTAPERITEFGVAPPPITRPKLKNRPTKLRQSKLHPWWRPTQVVDDTISSSGMSSGALSSERPGTATTITTTISAGSGEKSRKKHKSIRLGKNIQLEFVGIGGLREQLKERKEIKRRRAASTTQTKSV